MAHAQHEPGIHLVRLSYSLTPWRIVQRLAPAPVDAPHWWPVPEAPGLWQRELRIPGLWYRRKREGQAALRLLRACDVDGEPVPWATCPLQAWSDEQRDVVAAVLQRLPEVRAEREAEAAMHARLIRTAP